MTPPIRIDRDVEMAMRDGVALRGDVWRVDDETPRPALVLRTPYDRANTNSDLLRPLDAATAGYACVVQDTRGRYGSDGDWDILMWEQEARDGYDTIEWAAAQPWCDGNVGTFGASYLGIVQWMSAGERPPHLRAMAPAMTTSGELEALETGGALRLNHVVCWLAYMTLDWLGKQLAAGRPVDPAAVPRLMELVGDASPALEPLPLGEIPHFDFPDFPLPLRTLLQPGLGIAQRFDYERIDAPTLSVVGWYDFLCTATIESHMRLVERGGGGADARARHRLIVGPWIHDGRLPGLQGELNFGVGDGPFAGIHRQHLQFFDHHLKGAAEPLASVQYFLMGADEWRAAEAWPPPEAAAETWLLASGGAANTADGDGTLAPERPAGGAEQDRFAYDPADPVPTHGGRTLPMGTQIAGPFDHARVESRADVLCYSSEPRAEPLDLAGPVSVRLFAASSARDTDFVVRLLDVDPQGRAIPFAEGIQRARFRNGLGDEVLLEPGAVEEYAIALGHTAWRVRPGHRLRLHVTSSSFPAFDRNMNTGGPVGDDAAGVVAQQTVLHSAAHPSALIVHTIRQVVPDGR